MKRSDALIIGAGIIGLSLAFELRLRGLSVIVLERGEPGREASWAAAGMLSAEDPHTPAALQKIARLSAELFPDYIAAVEAASSMPAGFSRQGALVVSEQEIPEWGELRVSRDEAAQLEPELASALPYVYRLPEDSVDTRELMPALLTACKREGVEVHHEHTVFTMREGGLSTSAGEFDGGVIVNCAGAWANDIEGVPQTPVFPAKGQMLSLLPSPGRGVRHTIRSEEIYCVPRRDGRVAVGATVEHVGFDKRVDAGTIQRLHQLAAILVPALGQARIIEAWVGLRPATPDDLPLLGGYEDLPLYFTATGHFRNGILLAPVTAKLMADLVTGVAPAFDVSAFSPSRFTTYHDSSLY